MTKSLGILPPRRKWTAEEVDLLTRLYPYMKTESIAKQIGISISRTYWKAAKLGLKKSDAYLASQEACRLRKGDGVGAATRFKPGNQSWNKGKKGLTLGGVETQFKPGHRGGKAAELYQPIGTERISKDGYVQRKVNDDMPLQRRWRGVHIINWEAVNGQLPKGHVLVFKDGNKQNTAVENIELLSRAELMRRNSYHMNYPKEVAQLVQLRGAITRQINNRSKS
jgi:hypothetical protein